MVLKSLERPKDELDWPELGHACICYRRDTLKGKVAIICVPKIDDLPSAISLIAHEATHLWQYISEEIGEDIPSDEFSAYAMQSIVGELVADYISRGVKSD